MAFAEVAFGSPRISVVENRLNACACRHRIRGLIGERQRQRLVRMLNGEGREIGESGRDASGFQNRLELSGANNGVNFRNVLLDFVAITLDEAARDDELAGVALSLEASHLEDGVDRLLFGRVDKAAGVDDEDLGIFGTRSQVCAGAVEQAHHDLGVDEVLGTPRETNLHPGSPDSRFCFLGWSGRCRWGEACGHTPIVRGREKARCTWDSPNLFLLTWPEAISPLGVLDEESS